MSNGERCPLRPPWQSVRMLREPVQLTINGDGQVQLPLGLLAEAGLSCGSQIVAYSMGDGRITLRRAEDAANELLSTGDLT